MDQWVKNILKIYCQYEKCGKLLLLLPTTYNFSLYFFKYRLLYIAIVATTNTTHRLIRLYAPSKAE